VKRALATALLAWLVASAPAVAADRITIDARDTDIGDVIRLIGVEAGWNVIPDASVKPQRITFRLHDVDAATALDTLVQAYGLSVRRDRGIVIVGDAAAPAHRAGPPATAAVDVSNEKPTDVVKALRGVLPDASAIADDRSNSVILTGASDSVAAARTLVNQDAKRVAQVVRGWVAQDE